MAHFEQIFNGHTFYKVIPSKYIKTMNDLIECIISNKSNTNHDIIQNKKYPQYVTKSLQKWLDKMSEIKLRINVLQKNASKLNIWRYRADTSENSLVAFDELNHMFKKTTKITCYQTGNINKTYLDSIYKMLQNSRPIQIELFNVTGYLSTSNIKKVFDNDFKIQSSSGARNERDQYVGSSFIKIFKIQ
eukprot:101956_1